MVNGTTVALITNLDDPLRNPLKYMMKIQLSNYFSRELRKALQRCHLDAQYVTQQVSYKGNPVNLKIKYAHN